jgi:glutamate-1-semialdehyde 2,1-aminomutase
MNLSKEYFTRSLKIAPGGVHSPVRAFKGVDGEPIFFKSAVGPYLTSVDGEEFIDFCQSFGPLILGHRDSDVTLAVQDMIETAWTFGACEPYSLELAEFITSRIHWVEKIRFVSSGTEAVMSALRVARAATGRNKILKFDGCYHGHVDSLLVKSGSGLAGEASSDSAGVTGNQTVDTLVAPLDDEAAFDLIFNKYKNEIAAVIIEPLPANYGLLIQRKEFLAHVARVTQENGALLIFDEVISGFRVAFGGMAEILGIKPDLVTYGKIIGGGFPAGSYGGRRDLMDLVAPLGAVYQAGTLSANPVSMAAGLATLKKIESTEIYPVLKKRTENFSWELNKFFIKYKLPLSVLSYGSIFWIHGTSEKPIRAVGNISKNSKLIFKKLFHALLLEGIYLAPSGFEVSFMSLSHTDECLSLSLEKFNRALSKINLDH